MVFDVDAVIFRLNAVILRRVSRRRRRWKATGTASESAALGVPDVQQGVNRVTRVVAFRRLLEIQVNPWYRSVDA